MTAPSIAGLLCPACVLIAYMMLVIALKNDAANFRNRWHEEDEEDDNDA